nr:MAG TPA: hypothetical protein [Caudoviricetes sp.]
MENNTINEGGYNMQTAINTDVFIRQVLNTLVTQSGK